MASSDDERARRLDLQGYTGEILVQFPWSSSDLQNLSPPEPNRARGQRAKPDAAEIGPCASGFESLAVVEDRTTSRAVQAAWARLIKHLYQSDPLTCTVGGVHLRVISLIDDERVIRRILEHLNSLRCTWITPTH